MNKNIIDVTLKNLGISRNEEYAIFYKNTFNTKTNKNTKFIKSKSPIQNDILCKNIASLNINQYYQMIVDSEDAFKVWRRIPAPKRGEIIRLIGEEFRKHKDDLGTLISLETGKIKSEGDGEVQEMIDMVDFVVGQSRMLYGISMHSERPEHRMLEQWHPLGIVAVITAFNFPMAVWAWNALLAAVCGNVVVWKPSSLTPLCAIAIQKICQRVLKDNKMPSIFNMFIPENHDITTSFIEDEKVKLVSFTGSTNTGFNVANKVTSCHKRYLLELGGNNAIIVSDKANLSLAVHATTFGAVGTTGQRCTSTRRVFVQENVYDKFVKMLKKAYKGIKIGDPLGKSNHIGPLINLESKHHFERKIEDIKRDKNKLSIFYGGKLPIDIKGDSNYVQPVIVEMIQQSLLMKEEVFAPILYVIKYKTLEDAIRMQNDSFHGLSSAIFTEDIKESELFLSAVGSDCGIANVNIGTSGAEIGGAFGGEKDTGGGREAGSDSWKQYMRRQTNTINWSNELPLAQGVEFDL